MTPNIIDAALSCMGGFPADSESFDLSSLIARTDSSEEFLTPSTDIWNSEDPPNTDDLWSSASLGESDGAPATGMILSFDDTPQQPNDAPTKDVCSREQKPDEETSKYQPPWIPIDPGQPDRDCLDDDWEKWCCPLGITPMLGTSGCVPCNASFLRHVNI